MKKNIFIAISASLLSAKASAGLKASSLILSLLPVANSFQFITPELLKPWHAHLNQFETDSSEELSKSQSIIKRCPLLRVSHNDEISPEEFYDFVACHDPYADWDAIKKGEKVGHFFTRDKNQAHVAIRAGLNADGLPIDGQPMGEPFQHSLLWHMDNVGSSSALPPRVSGLHFLTIPENGGETMFANLPNGIAKIPLAQLEKFKKLEGLYSKDTLATLQSYYAPDGIHRLGPNQDEQQGLVKVPLFYHNEDGLLTIAFTPARFCRFVGMSKKESWETIRHIFLNYILTEDNIVTVSPEAGDTIVFRNDQLIHSSTPWERYEGRGRLHWLAFVPTTESPIAPEEYLED